MLVTHCSKFFTGICSFNPLVIFEVPILEKRNLNFCIIKRLQGEKFKYAVVNGKYMTSLFSIEEYLEEKYEFL